MTRVPAALTATVVAFAVLVLLALPGSSQITGGAAGDQQGRLQLITVSDWVGPNATFHAEIDLREVPGAASVSFTLHQPVTDRVGLDRSITRTQLGATMLRGDATISATEPRVAVIDIPVSDSWPAPDKGVVLNSSGVHPLVVSATGADGTDLTTLVTQLIRLPAATSTTPPLAVGLVVQQHETPSIALDGGTFLAPEAADHLLESLRTLDSFPSVALSTMPSASTLIDLTLSRPEVDQAGFASLRPGPARQSIASTYAPIALGSWLADDLGPEAQVQFAAGTDTLTRQLGAAPDHRVALLDPSVDPAALQLLQTRGTGSVIIPSDQLLPAIDTTRTSAPTLGFDVRTTDGRRLHAIAADSGVSARLLADPSDPVTSAHAAIAELALIRLATPGAARGLAVVVPGSTPTATLRNLLKAFAGRDGVDAGEAGSPLVSPVTLDDLFTVTDVTTTYEAGVPVPVVQTFSSEEPANLGDYPAALRSARRSIAGLLSMVPEAPYLAGSAVHRSLASGDRSLTEDQRSGVVVSAEGAVRSITGEIIMTPEQVVTLTSHSGKVPLNIENRLQVPALVHVTLRSAKLDFPEGEEFDQVLAPGTTTRVDAQVTTRATGTFPLDVSVVTADRTTAVTSARFTVRSTAVSGIGLLISIGAGLFLLVWWLRHFRTARRASKLVDSDPIDDPDRSDEAEGRTPPGLRP